MRRWADVAALAALAALAGGCLGGGSQHATLSASDALAQARADGFVNPRRVRSVAWRCDGKTWDQARPGEAGPGGHFVVSSYDVVFDDKRVPVQPDSTARIAMTVVVFPDAATARRCADALIYQATHAGPAVPFKVIDPTTVQTHPDARGVEFPEDAGEYNTSFAHGRVFAIGFAHNRAHWKIVRADLERLAAEIAG